MEPKPPKAEPPKRKRRWFQFSLRSLLVVVTIAAVQCGVCLPALKEWQERKQTDALIEQLQPIRWERLTHRHSWERFSTSVFDTDGAQK